MKRYSVLFAAIGMICCFSCKDEQVIEENNEIEFGVNIEKRKEVLAIRSAGENGNSDWSEGDQIGISMIMTGGHDIVNNVCYNVSPKGEVSPDIKGVAYPLGRGTVDFISYFPYRKDCDSGSYNIDLVDQSDKRELDLLYSNNARFMDKTRKRVMLNFKHALSMISVNIRIEKGVPGTVEAFVEMPTRANFNILENSFESVGAVEEIPINDGNVLVLPEEECKLVLKRGEETEYKIIPKGLLKASTHYKIVITVGSGIEFGDATIVDWDTEDLDMGTITFAELCPDMLMVYDVKTEGPQL